VNSEIYFVSTLTTVYREYIPKGFKVIVKSEVGGFTGKSADFLPAKWSLNSGTGLWQSVMLAVHSRNGIQFNSAMDEKSTGGMVIPLRNTSSCMRNP
jgi:hypothetical protein